MLYSAVLENLCSCWVLPFLEHSQRFPASGHCASISLHLGGPDLHPHTVVFLSVLWSLLTPFQGGLSSPAYLK